MPPSLGSLSGCFLTKALLLLALQPLGLDALSLETFSFDALSLETFSFDALSFDALSLETFGLQTPPLPSSATFVSLSGVALVAAAGLVL